MLVITTLFMSSDLVIQDGCLFDQCRRNGNHHLGDIEAKYARNKSLKHVYSSRFPNLIRRCLDPSPSNRPTQLELMDQTRRGLKFSLKRTGGHYPKLCYKNYDINGMEQGNADFVPKQSDLEGHVATRNTRFTTSISISLPKSLPTSLPTPTTANLTASSPKTISST
jgi:hypothetical protein